MRVLVALSGGVDSSVAAALMLEGGHEVEAVTLVQTCRRDPGPGCCADADDARKVAAQLGIPHRTLDYTDLFCREVIRPFAAAYRQGRTPNPCIECNRQGPVRGPAGGGDAGGLRGSGHRAPRPPPR